METSFIWSRGCLCKQLLVQLEPELWRQQQEGLDAELECSLRCGAEGTKSTPRVMSTASLGQWGLGVRGRLEMVSKWLWNAVM